MRLSLLVISCVLASLPDLLAESPSNSPNADFRSELKADWLTRLQKVSYGQNRENDPAWKHWERLLRAGQMSNALKKAPAEFIRAEIGRLKTESVNFDGPHPISRSDDFERQLAESLMTLLIDQTNRSDLEDVLLVNCPHGIEFPLVRRLGPGAVYLLIDAYNSGKNDEVKRSALTALSKAFKKLRDQHPDNEAFVNHCKAYLQSNLQILRLNGYYVDTNGNERPGEELFLKDRPERQRSELKKEWLRRIDVKKKQLQESGLMKSWRYEIHREMLSLLTNVSGEFIQEQINRVKETSVHFDESSYLTPADRFEPELVIGLVSMLMHRANRTELKELLLMNCPPGIGALPLEYLLVRNFGPEGIYLFIDSYYHGKTDEVKGDAIKRLAEAFKKLFAQDVAKNDPTYRFVELLPRDQQKRFVDQCKAYVDKNLSRLRLNPDYINNEFGEKYREDLFYLLPEKRDPVPPGNPN